MINLQAYELASAFYHSSLTLRNETVSTEEKLFERGWLITYWDFKFLAAERVFFFATFYIHFSPVPSIRGSFKKWITHQ
jgi:hypothetical protein